MKKKEFIQQIVIRSLPEHGKLAAAVSYAENLWEGLNQYGYGDEVVVASKPRASKSFVDDMNDTQKKQFNAFWEAFGYKKDINGAAMRWLQMGALSEADAKFIIDAARKEQAKKLPDGQARKMAQGWLFEKRWMDYVPTASVSKNNIDFEARKLFSELSSVRMLYEKTGDEALLSGIHKLERKLSEARAGQPTR